MLIVERLSQPEHFTEVEQSIATYLLNIGREIEKKSARSISAELFVSPSTISRFCQLLGFSGFSEFQEDYLKEIRYLESNVQSINPNNPFTIYDKNVALANKIATLFKETIDETVGLLHHDVLQKGINIVNQSTEIYVTTAGDATEMARTFRNRCLKIGKKVVVEERNDNAFFQACFASAESCFILISYSGETEQLLKIAEKLKSRGIATIAITSFGDNRLSRLTDLTLSVSTYEKLIDNLGNFSSLLSIQFVLDILYTSLFNQQREANYKNRIAVSRAFEQRRKSTNPIINDRKEDA
ncbi:TPA: MurR/RpiR family transcriptional regulator [Streptococcus suis]|nr:MurR/RpiR family transcriptional regulator [Streptococcus suis]